MASEIDRPALANGTGMGGRNAAEDGLAAGRDSRALVATPAVCDTCLAVSL